MPHSPVLITTLSGSNICSDRNVNFLARFLLNFVKNQDVHYMSAMNNKITYLELAQHLQKGATHQLFAQQGTTNVIATTHSDRNDPRVFELEELNKDASIEAQLRGSNDIHELAALPTDDLNKQLEQLRNFVNEQRKGVEEHWGQHNVGVFASRADALLKTANPKSFRTASKTIIDGLQSKGWDENIQTEIVAARAHGRGLALENYAMAPNLPQLEEMHDLLTESSSMARSPTAVVAGSHDATGAFSAHPTAKAYSTGSAVGSSVGGSPRSHALRTGIMQAWEQYGKDNGLNVVERQMSRVVIARRATTNAFEAPLVPGTTNDMFQHSKRIQMMTPGREHDKVFHDRDLKAAQSTSTGNGKLIFDAMVPSSPRR